MNDAVAHLDPALVQRFADIVGDRYALHAPDDIAPYLTEPRGLWHGRSQLVLLEACRRHNPGVRLVYSGTRQIYGRPRYLPVDEQHPIDPVDVNGVNETPHYHWLKEQAPGILGTRGIKWNFTKFLIARNGKVAGRYGPTTKPEALERDIEALL